MKKKLKMIFGVGSGLSFVGLGVVGWVPFFISGIRMESTMWSTLMWILLWSLIGCLLIFSALMLSDVDLNEGGSIPPAGGPGIPW